MTFVLVKPYTAVLTPTVRQASIRPGKALNMNSMTRRILIAAVIAGALVGCASNLPLLPSVGSNYKDRAETRVDGGVRVSTAVLSAA